MRVVRLIDANQITGTVAMKVLRRCCNPLCHDKATWITENGKFIWCDNHAPWEEF